MAYEERFFDDERQGAAERVSFLATPSATRAVLARHGLATKKSLGQNFLVNDGVIAKICELSEVGPADSVLEVGPGIGTLTVALCARANRVFSVERDTDLPVVLAETCGDFDNFTLLSKDAQEVSEADFAQAGFAPTKFIANLPYAVAATLVLDFFQRFDTIESATVMVQSEVADRMMAAVGTKDYAAYSVKLNLLAKPVGRFQVAPGSFFPPPRVTSAVIRLDRRDDLGVTEHEAKMAGLMAEAAFATRRKTISNSMKTFFSGRAGGADILAQLPVILDEAGIDARRRGESLTLEEFITLARTFEAIMGEGFCK